MAWWVIFGHIARSFGWNLPLIDTPTLAVDVFILLSGFVIAMLIARKAEPYPAYIVRRAFRLFPLYLPVLMISTALLPIQLAVWQTVSPSADNSFRIKAVRDAMANLPWHLGTHIPLLQGLVPNRFAGTLPFSILGQAWSISLEWQFYLVAPFLIRAVLGRKWFKAAAIVLAFALMSRFFPGAFLGAKIYLFGAGIATYAALQPELRREALIAAAVCAVAAIARQGPMQLIPLGLWAGVVASSMSPVQSLRHLPARVLGSRVLFHMGQISYSIYLLHMVPFFLSLYLCSIAGSGPLATQVIVVLATTVVTYLGALACYHAVEKQGIRLGSRLAGKVL
jgi:peptidoglycan/LPS O-acetylase OafA/YrhL